MDSCANFRECPFVDFHARSRKPRRSWIHGVKFSKWRTSGNHADASAFHHCSPTQTKIFPTSEPQGFHAKYWYNNSLGDIFTYPYYFDNALGIQHRNLSIAIALIYFARLMLTSLLPRLFSTSGRLAAILACWWHPRSTIISVFDRRSIMNRLYWHNQQVGYLCFIPFVWEQRGVIAAVADQTTMISHL